MTRLDARLEALATLSLAQLRDQWQRICKSDAPNSVPTCCGAALPISCRPGHSVA